MLVLEYGLIQVLDGGLYIISRKHYLQVCLESTPKILFLCWKSLLALWFASCILARRIYLGSLCFSKNPLLLCQHLPIECRICSPNVRLHEWNPGLARVGVLPWLQQSQGFTTRFWISSSPFSPVWQLKKFFPDLQRKLEVISLLFSFALPS